jgi:arylsulfate sulfotransferase
MNGIIRTVVSTRLRFEALVAGAVVLMLSGCGGGGGGSPAAAAANAAATSGSAASTVLNPHSQAALSGLQIISTTAGPSPFIEKLTLEAFDTTYLQSVEFIVQPKAGSASKAVDVTYSKAALTERNYLKVGGTTFTVPVFALYAGYTNQVTLNFSFQDGSTQTLPISLTTAEYTDPTGVYLRPTIFRQRVAGSSLGFNFFYIKSLLTSPVIVDTDGEIRWVAPGVTNSMSSALQGDEFVIGDQGSPRLYRLRLDGSIAGVPLQATDITLFYHNIDYGKTGLVGDVNTTGTGGVQNVESTATELTNEGLILNQWDMAQIISNYMTSHGDIASNFVRPGSDWFHMNATTYDPTDDTIIVSSRENFVIKLDYKTADIIWIFGDPTKYWYTFPSLRAKALTLAAGGLYPIGQHALSITADGHLMLFNDGLGSLNQPSGEPAGQSRTYSAVSAYSIDASTMIATNVWNFENGQTIYAEACSSAYFAQQGSLLVDYADADNMTHARLVGLDSSHQVAFDFQYPTVSCNTAWNAVPIYLESFAIN